MAQLECAHCTKSFKSETGYHWHITHQHPDTIASNGQHGTRLTTDEDRYLQSTEKVASAETKVSEPMGEEDLIGEILDSLGEISEFQQQMFEEMAQLRGGLEQVKGIKVAAESLKQEVAHVKTLVGSLEHRLSRTDRVSDALACLVLDLDTKQESRDFAYLFFEGPTPEDLKEARRVI